MITFSEQFTQNKKRLETDSELRNKIACCPLCNSFIADRKITLYKQLLRVLSDVYQWCLKNNKHEFETKEVKHLMGKNEYARFGDLVRFGGIVYKPKNNGKSRKALFGINMDRAKAFFTGKSQIPLQLTLNQITNEATADSWVSINQVPELKDLLDENGLYDPQLKLKI